MKKLVFKTLTLDKIVGGGQALGQLEDGKKAFVWGGLPGENVTVQVTKKKSHLVEGVVTEVLSQSPERTSPQDPDSYLSTSPWQIMTFEAEQHYKAALIEEAFELHDIVVPEPIDVYTDGKQFEYRNKIEFSWWWDNETNQLDLAFFLRGTHGKIPVDGTSLASPAITEAGHRIRDVLRARNTSAFDLKTVIIRCNQQGSIAMQLYVKEENFEPLSDTELQSLNAAGFELIYSNPKSPASVITKRLQAWGTTTLTDTILGTPFTYAVEGFFQINIPVYEQALRDMQAYIPEGKPVIDLYSGVGSIGLTIGGNDVTLVEINEHAVREMQQNIKSLGRSATAVLAASEKALDHITSDATIIVDPPRAGLHDDVVKKLLETTPERIVYLSCNPVTQARDVANLSERYGIRAHRGYNFFPRTPHIEHLVVLDKRT
ncbi:MAG TPA: RsmD family RNA methyltransferase [Candidatus Saccharimonadales bacterium]|nr:RsmD family RNA methyltransferase [Candidatus Saccharimonadales bacterium]